MGLRRWVARHRQGKDGDALPVKGCSRESLAPSFRQALPYFLPLLVVLLVANAAVQGGWWIAVPLIFFFFAETFDQLFGTEERNIDLVKASDNQLSWYQLALWTCVTLWPITLVFVLWQMLVVGRLALWEVLLMAFVVGNVSTMILVAGHDVIHERTNWKRWIGEFLLSSVGCAHYAGDHIYVHHAHVATPHDPMSSRKGQTFWQYLPWAIGGSIIRSWRDVCRRLALRHLPPWHISNPFWRYALFNVAWFVLAYWMGGVWGVFVFSIHVALAILTLRLGDYIEHYGLTRLHLSNGRFEPVQAWHSWSAAARYSNWLYYNTQRHADHHCKPRRFYALLQNRAGEQAPRMPSGYAAMSNMAMSPKRWFETMDPLVDAWRLHHYPRISNWSVYDSSAFAARPQSFDAIAEIHAAAPRLSHWIERFPELLDSLHQKEFTDLDIPSGFGPDPEFETIARSGLTRLYWTREFGVSEMLQHIADIPVQGVRETVDAVRVWSNAQAFQIGMHTIRGNLSPIEAETALSNVAEASVVAVLSAAREHFGDRCVEDSVAAIVLDDLASGEVMPGCDLNVLFVYDGKTTRHRHLKMLCSRYRRVLQDLSRGSILFSPLTTHTEHKVVHSLAGFAEHHTSMHRATESLSLTRARCVFTSGEPEIATKFESARCGLLADPRFRNTLVEMLREEWSVRQVEPANANPPEIDHMPGGCKDVDCIARLLQLTFNVAPAGNKAPRAMSVFQLACEQGVVSDVGCRKLEEAVTMWHNLKGIQALVMNNKAAGETVSSSVKAVIAKSCGVNDFDSLTIRVGEIATSASYEIDALRRQLLDRYRKNPEATRLATNSTDDL